MEKERLPVDLQHRKRSRKYRRTEVGCIRRQEAYPIHRDGNPTQRYVKGNRVKEIT